MTAFGGSVAIEPHRREPEFELRASHLYDVARSSPNNDRRWQYAQDLSAAESHSPEMRRIIRNRARYEVANNSFATGLVAGLASDVVGIGPRLQISTGDPAADAAIEAEWEAWADETGLGDTLQTSVHASIEVGEAFWRFFDEPDNETVSLGFDLIEADRVAGEYIDGLNDPGDGITYTRTGRPVSYNVLSEHPGAGVVPTYSTKIQAGAIVHLFRQTRPGQLRGVSELAPALSAMAELRAYQRAVLLASEVAASQAMVIQKPGPVDDEGDAVSPLDVVDFEYASATTLPEGWQISGFSPTQPTANHPQYVRSQIVYIARCLNVPANIALGDSSGFNYASGRLDHQTYELVLASRRKRLETRLLDSLLARWLRMAVRNPASPVTREMAEAGRRVAHEWLWRNRGHVDPSKEIAAAIGRMDAGLSNRSIECGVLGRDWEAVADQAAREKATIAEINERYGGESQSPAKPKPEPEPKDEGDNAEAEGSEPKDAGESEGRE